jgi:hypothetical protein
VRFGPQPAPSHHPSVNGAADLPTAPPYRLGGSSPPDLPPGVPPLARNGRSFSTVTCFNPNGFSWLWCKRLRQQGLGLAPRTILAVRPLFSQRPRFGNLDPRGRGEEAVGPPVIPPPPSHAGPPPRRRKAAGARGGGGAEGRPTPLAYTCLF